MDDTSQHQENGQDTENMNDTTENNDTEKNFAENSEDSTATEDNVTQFQAQEDAATEEPSDELTALREENTAMKDKMLRALAEVENIRRRSEKEREDTAKYAVSRFARNVLSVADNLRRALDSVTEEARTEHDMLENIYIGVEGIERELLRALESEKITKIVPMDEPFDANFHEVMFEAEIPGKTPGHVVEVLEPGYLIHDRLLRPARVGVAKRASLSPDERVDEEA